MTDLNLCNGKTVTAINLVTNHLGDTEEVKIEFADGTAIQFRLERISSIPYIEWNFYKVTNEKTKTIHATIPNAEGR